jgi:hypothetical protein
VELEPLTCNINEGALKQGERRSKFKKHQPNWTVMISPFGLQLLKI